MKRTFHQMTAAVILLAASAAPPATAFPSSIRPGRPPDPLGGRTTVCLQQAGSAPDGWSRICCKPALATEGARR